MKICRGILNVVKIGQEYRAFYMAEVRLIVAGDIKSPQKRVKWHQAVRTAEEV